jgi:hypothetical protein
MKLQAPNLKLLATASPSNGGQGSFKHQVSKACDGLGCFLGDWSLDIPWDLEFGVWSFFL